jgi:hypothetical protein
MQYHHALCLQLPPPSHPVSRRCCGLVLGPHSCVRLESMSPLGAPLASHIPILNPLRLLKSPGASHLFPPLTLLSLSLDALREACAPGLSQNASVAPQPMVSPEVRAMQLRALLTLRYATASRTLEEPSSPTTETGTPSAACVTREPMFSQSQAEALPSSLCSPTELLTRLSLKLTSMASGSSQCSPSIHPWSFRRLSSDSVLGASVLAAGQLNCGPTCLWTLYDAQTKISLQITCLTSEDFQCRNRLVARFFDARSTERVGQCTVILRKWTFVGEYAPCGHEPVQSDVRFLSASLLVAWADLVVVPTSTETAEARSDSLDRGWFVLPAAPPSSLGTPLRALSDDVLHKRVALPVRCDLFVCVMHSTVRFLKSTIAGSVAHDAVKAATGTGSPAPDVVVAVMVTGRVRRWNGRGSSLPGADDVTSSSFGSVAVIEVRGHHALWAQSLGRGSVFIARQCIESLRDQLYIVERNTSVEWCLESSGIVTTLLSGQECSSVHDIVCSETGLGTRQDCVNFVGIICSRNHRVCSSSVDTGESQTSSYCSSLSHDTLVGTFPATCPTPGGHCLADALDPSAVIEHFCGGCIKAFDAHVRVRDDRGAPFVDVFLDSRVAHARLRGLVPGMRCVCDGV